MTSAVAPGRPARSRWRRLRRVAFALAAAGPVLVMLWWLRADVLADRTAAAKAQLRLGAAALGGEVEAIVQSARSVGRVIADAPAVAADPGRCAAWLGRLLHGLPAYGAIGVFDAAGHRRCATPGAGAPGEAGRFTAARGAHEPTLPLAVHGEAAVVVLNLRLDWLGRRLPAGLPASGALTVADRDGTILARAPDGSAFVGMRLPAALRAPSAGGQARAVAGFGGEPRFAVTVPAGDSGLLVSASQAPPGLFAGGGPALLDRLGGAVGLLLILATLANIWLLLRFNARLDRRPVAALAGMTELLARQRAELQALNATLEARVAARTRDLVASRNQLQLKIVERARTEAELRQAQKLQAVGQLAGGIAHDFNNLLSGITTALDLLRRRLGPRVGAPGAADVATPLDTAEEQAARGARLTARLLTFARRQRLLPAAIDVNRLVGELPGLVAGSLGPDIAIRTELASDAWPAFVDPGQLEAALLNLVFNARDAMPGGGTLSLATANVLVPRDVPEGASLAAGAYVAVRVGDTGAGIAPEVLARVFEPFFTTKPAGSASGLGLSQVHGLALQSGGDVRIASDPARGTVVTLLLPRAAAGAGPGGGASPPPGLRILVADDDHAVRRMTGELLAERGHHPVLAADAAEALAVLEKDLADTGGSFDVLLADYVMPGTNGVALILMAQALQPRMHALLVTGHAELEPDDPLRPQDILRKPFTIAALEQRLAAIRAEARGGGGSRSGSRALG